MEPENQNLLLEGAKGFGVYLDENTLAAFDLFLRDLLKWNQKINLTAIRTEKGIIIKHFLDSLSVYPYLPKSASLLDIGSGAGFPGIPLKIVDPSFEITLIDSVHKKVDFQRHIIRRLGLRRIEAVHGRVQDGEIVRQMEGRFDHVLSRAFSDLQTFLLFSYPFLKKGGIALAMKGELKGEEIQILKEGEKVRYRLQKAVAVTLPFPSSKRTILLFEKR
ncbi:MAG: 16S rRNA (guanine(527)-N(7))-methyltransferase RsmG [Deltaproteobacteria bacterium RBG_16_48_10]|nr:MAG: 16S rRNA (guanine(527)-N(7))-methyltransferase RsmG [Deltaproteobacteria bacterium RBG_16_48_10]